MNNGGKAAPADFYDLKGYIENLLSLSSAGNRAKFVAKSYTALHPGQSAAIMLDGEENWFYQSQLHPDDWCKECING